MSGLREIHFPVVVISDASHRAGGVAWGGCNTVKVAYIRPQQRLRQLSFPSLATVGSGAT